MIMRSKYEESECWRAGASELAQAIRDGEIGPEAAVEAHLKRIAEVNPRVNAATSVLADEARAAAQAAEDAVRSGR
ncbi:MAG: hypothetical protein ACRDPM_23880, partial [Solirubrobacteraceae bacterium]